MKFSNQRKFLAIALACSVFLGACGGGEDLQSETVAQMETATSPTDAQREIALGLATASSNTADSTEDYSIRFGPDDFVGDDVPVLDPLTFVNEQANDSNALLSSNLAAGVVTKWNPGHYIEYGSNAGDFVIDAGLNETAGMPHVKGIMVRANWRQLEKSKGVYDFSRIDRYLNKAKAKGKRLFLTLGTKTFDGDKAVPDYLRTAQYSGGAFRIGTIKGTYGENASLHDDDVRNRLIALVQALGKRYNKDNSFEGITFTETAFGMMVKPLSDAQKKQFFSNLAKVDTAARAAFPNSVVLQFINYPANLVPPLFQNMKDKGVGMGGPDVFINDPDLERSAYVFNDKAKGVIPIGMKVESDSYEAVRHGGPYVQVDVRKIYTFARDQLHSNYVFWYRHTSRHNPWQDVLRMFKGEAFPQGGAGGLNAGCPSKFASCAPKL
ncbi:hypothetical protein [Azohydromonas lata]|uniref:Uncharacterized protein n=1 Tax=Azohydromonas lata TaxID=45677 RepID=A0ABU5IC79_9BURK|nr:hypothetical protein [Azohydromonas lata]MDZ5456715.1 hypothetical protein [Azohydromonas lata]